MQFLKYFKESFLEITTRVTWPTVNVLQKSTMVVITATLIISLLVWLMDVSSSFTLKSLYTIFR